MGRLRTNTKAGELIKEFKNYTDLKDFNPSINLPIYLEIGSGKGDFLITYATANPDVFFIGIEKYSTVILKALKKIESNQLNLTNLLFTCLDANEIKPEEFNFKIAKLFLNFSDPWPKKRHAKRRLTSNHFLDIYKGILAQDACVEFKTDNDKLFEFTINTLNDRRDVDIVYTTNDLYKELDKEINKYNIKTEYEQKFTASGKTINKLIFKFK